MRRYRPFSAVLFAVAVSALVGGIFGLFGVLLLVAFVVCGVFVLASPERLNQPTDK